MATVHNGARHRDENGLTDELSHMIRFSDIPPAIDIPVSGLDAEEAVEVNLEDHLEDPTELCQLLENERAAKNLWITIALAYAKQGQIDNAIDILTKALSSLLRSGPKERLSVLTCLAWMYLFKSRRAPRVPPEGHTHSDVRTKEFYLKEATTSINEALRINPAFPPLYLTRGVLSLLKASLVTSTKTGQVESERTELLRQALKSFDDAMGASSNKNMVALLGKARTLFLLKQYPAALQSYQDVMSRMPGLTDPDPRIGIGCCYWALQYPEQARMAWERSLELNPQSKAAHALLGIWYLYESSKYPASDPQFNILYKKAMIEHTKKAYTIDKNFPISCATFASYFLLTGRYETMEPLARKAIEQTDINAIASDGWYLLARKEHNQQDFQKANECYNKADQARGGQDRGYLPAKFGMIQIMVQSQDLAGAKFRLEKLAPTARNVEAMTLLGCIYAEEVFAAQRSVVREDRSADIRKAIALLENVRKLWKDEKSRVKPDETILLYLARLYEIDNPIESMKCLQTVEAMQLEKIPEEDRPNTNEDEGAYIAQLREHLPPQLLNNMGCFLYGAESYALARETFQIALNACVKLTEKQEAERQAAEEEGDTNMMDLDTSDTDALVTTISYNLARTYEALDLYDESQKVYEGLLARHSDYTDAQARLAYMALRFSPRKDGPKKVQGLYATDYSNTEVRALMGWYHHSAKKKTSNLAEDVENRHYKHTLQGYDKHDIYSLTGMGNVHLAIARDMPRNTDAEKDKRSKMYQKAYEFFDKALQLDPKNAYAAQGIAIALCDDKKNYSDAVQILTKVKDTVRDASVYVNLGHVMTELRQYQRGIDNYEIALQKDGHENAQLLACLSRAWLLKGKQDRSVVALNTALDFMRRALATQPDSPHLQFNVAFIQFQIVQQINSTDEASRTLEDVNAAIDGLEEAIDTFEQVARHKQPPYPRTALEQRAAMGKNTMRNQLERTKNKQITYESENATKLKEAKQRREEELRKREEAERIRREEEEERVKKIADERRKIIEETERLAEKLRAEASAREAAEYTDDEETGERIKRKSKKSAGGKRKKRDDDDGFIENDDGDLFDGNSERSVSRTPFSGVSDNEGGGGGEPRERKPKSEKPQKKRRKLERKGGKGSRAVEEHGKFKSAAVVVDSDSEGDEPSAVPTPTGGGDDSAVATPISNDDEDVGGGASNGRRSNSRTAAVLDDDEDDDQTAIRRPVRKRKQLRTIADDDEDEDEDEGGDGGNQGNADLARAALAASGGDEEDE